MSVLIISFAFCRPSYAEEATDNTTTTTWQVNFHIRHNSTLAFEGTWNGPTSTDDILIADNQGQLHSVNSMSVLAGLTALDAQSDAFSISDLAYYENFNPPTFLINCISLSAVDTATCYNWQYLVNDVSPWDGVNNYILRNNDDVYLYFGNPHRVILSTTTPYSGDQFIAETQKYNYHDDMWGILTGVTVGITQPDPNNPWSPLVIATSTVNSAGQATFSLMATSTYSAGIAEDFYYPNVSFVVLDRPTGYVAQTNHVVVNYLNNEMFNQNVSPTSTWFFDSAGALYSTSTVSALGVLAEASRQGNFPLTIQSGWGSYYVSDIAGHAAQGFDGWIYNINQKDPGIGMNDYPIKDSELLTVFYSVWPWKMESNTSSVYIGDNVTFKALNYASSTWQTSPSTTISINNQLFVTDDVGQYVYTPSATGTLSAFVYGSESWPPNSPTISVTVLSTSTLPADETTPPPDNGGGGGGGGGNNNNDEPPANPTVSDADIKTAVDKVIAYLKSQQDATGKIIDGGTTDWAIMSFGANGEYASDIKNGDKSLLDFAKKYNFTDDSEMNKCADTRDICSRYFAGVQPTDLAILDLKEK